MANLFPLGINKELVKPGDVISKRPVGYRPGVFFDYEAEDFKRDGQNKMLDSDPIESWKAWCINCMLTQRYRYLGYSSDFGIDFERVFSAGSHAEAESILTREITEAIMADRYGRCAYIERLDFNWPAPDAVQVRAILHGIDDVTIDITAYLKKQGGDT